MIFWYFAGGMAALWGLLGSYVMVIRWVWKPIKLKGTTYSLVRPQWSRATDADLTPEERDELGRLSADFARAGFGPPVMHLLTGSISGADGLEALMTHPTTGDIGIILVARTKLARTFTLVIRSEFGDGTRVVTGASRNIGFFPRNPADDAANFSWVRDVATLWEAHRRRLDRAGKGGLARVTPDVDAIETYKGRTWDREHKWWVKCGYRWLDAASGRYRPTWKGAFLTVWKLNPPIKGWRARSRDRRFRRAWRALGMDAWQPGPTEPVAALAVPPESFADTDGPALRYAAGLAEGEIRWRRMGETLTVTCGGPTVGRVLLRQWGKLLSAMFFTSLLAITGAAMWSQWRQFSFLPAGQRWRLIHDAVQREALYALFGAAFLMWDAVRIFRAVRRAHGTITILANPGGLHFENLHGRCRRGRIARADVHALSVALAEVGVSGRRYRLELTPTDVSDRKLTLLRSRSITPLREVRDAMLTAMGMKAEEPMTETDRPGT
jgi:hypothetical protein